MTVRARQSCGLGFTAGRTWALLHYTESWPEPYRRLLDLAWLALLFLPAGIAAGNLRNLLIVAPLTVAGLTLPPVITRILFTPPLQYAAALIGLAAGFVIGRMFAARMKQAGETGA
jgi:hypothetical protein